MKLTDLIISQHKVRLEKEISDLKKQIDDLERSKRCKENLLDKLHTRSIQSLQQDEDLMQKNFQESILQA